MAKVYNPHGDAMSVSELQIVLKKEGKSTLDSTMISKGE